jgi:hypothetical protein
LQLILTTSEPEFPITEIVYSTIATKESGLILAKLWRPEIVADGFCGGGKDAANASLSMVKLAPSIPMPVRWTDFMNSRYRSALVSEA